MVVIENMKILKIENKAIENVENILTQ